MAVEDRWLLDRGVLKTAVMTGLPLLEKNGDDIMYYTCKLFMHLLHRFFIYSLRKHILLSTAVFKINTFWTRLTLTSFMVNWLCCKHCPAFKTTKNWSYSYCHYIDLEAFPLA